jgi:hypothetical protein
MRNRRLRCSCGCGWLISLKSSVAPDCFSPINRFLETGVGAGAYLVCPAPVEGARMFTELVWFGLAGGRGARTRAFPGQFFLLTDYHDDITLIS